MGMEAWWSLKCIIELKTNKLGIEGSMDSFNFTFEL